MKAVFESLRTFDDHQNVKRPQKGTGRRTGEIMYHFEGLDTYCN